MLKRNRVLDLQQNYFLWNDMSKRIFEKILRKEEQKLKKTMPEKIIQQCMDQLLSYPIIKIKKFDSLSTIDCCKLRDNCLKNNKSTANFTHSDNSIKNEKLNNNRCLKNKKNQLKKSSEKSICNNKGDIANNFEESKLFKKIIKSEGFEKIIQKKYKKRKKINRSPVSSRIMNLQPEDLFKYSQSSNNIHKDENRNLSLNSLKAEAIQKIFKIQLVNVCENSNRLKNVDQKQEPKSIHEGKIVLENKENETVIKSKKKRKRKSIDSGIGRSTPPQEMIQDLNGETFEIKCENNNSKRRKSKSSINIMKLEKRIKKFKEELKLIENSKSTKSTKSLTSLSDVSDCFLIEKNNNNIDSVTLMTKTEHDNASDATVIPDNQRLDYAALDRNTCDEVKVLMQSIVNGFSLREQKSQKCSLVVSPDLNIANISTNENKNSLTNIISKNETVNKLNLSTNNLDIFEQSPSPSIKDSDTIKEKRKYRRKNTVVIKKKADQSRSPNSAVLTSTSSTISIPSATSMVTDQENKSIASILTKISNGTVEQSLTLTAESSLLYQSCPDYVPNIQYLRVSDQGNMLNSHTGQQNDHFHQNGIFLYDCDIKTIVHCILQMRVFKMKFQSNSLINHMEMKYIMKISETAVFFMKKLASHFNITSWRVLINKIAVNSRTTGLCKEPILENELNEIVYFYIEHFHKKNNLSQIPSQQKTRPIMYPVVPDVARYSGLQVTGAIYSNGFPPNAVVPGSYSNVGNHFGPCTTPMSSSRHALQPNPYEFHETFNYCHSPLSQPLHRYPSTNTTTGKCNVPVYNIQITNDQIMSVYCQIQIYNQLVKRTKEIIIKQQILLAQKMQTKKTSSAEFHGKTLVNQERTDDNSIVHVDESEKQEQIQFNFEKAKKKKNLHSILDKILEKKTSSNENEQYTRLSREVSVEPNLIKNQKIINEESYMINSSIGTEEFMKEKLEYSDINKEMVKKLSSESTAKELSLLTTPIITAVFSIPYDMIDVIDENPKEVEGIIG